MAGPGSPVTAIAYSPPSDGSPTLATLVRQRIGLFVADPRGEIQTGLIVDTLGDEAQLIGLSVLMFLSNFWRLQPFQESPATGSIQMSPAVIGRHPVW
jgi:hypothetical protein